MRLLLVEDDVMVASGIKLGLSEAGYAVDWVGSGERAQEVLQKETFDIAVVDIGLPGMDGLALLRHLRRPGMASPAMPGLILTARDALPDRVQRLELGADDYMVQPFELPALLAAYAYGPVSGIAVCLIKNLIKLPSTSTAAVGELFNFVMGALFVGVAGFVYKRSKTRRSALIGAGLGALVMAVVSVPYNYFIVYPAYVVMYHLPLEAIIGMYQAINPSVDGLLACLLTFNLPFTLFKGLLDAALCFLIYKPLSPILHGRK